MRLPRPLWSGHAWLVILGGGPDPHRQAVCSLAGFSGMDLGGLAIKAALESKPLG